MGGQTTVDAEGATVGEVLGRLTRDLPGRRRPAARRRRRRCTGSSTSTSTTTTCATSAGSDAPVADGDEVTLLPAVAGGARSDPRRLGPRPHRAHARGRRQRAVARPERRDPGQARGPEPRRLGQGPRRARAGRGGRGATGAWSRASPDQMLLEPSSGNTGIALALVCRLRGYHLKVVLPDNVSPERRQLLAAYGAEIIDSPGAEGSNGAVRLARRLAGEHPEWVFLYQYANPANPDGPLPHDRPRDPRRRAPRSRTSSPGSARRARCIGVGRFLKEHRPGVQVWAVEPPAGEIVDGLRSLDDGYVPPIFTDARRRGRCSTAASSCGRASPSSGRGASPSSASSSGCPRARRWPARCKCASSRWRRRGARRS